MGGKEKSKPGMSSLIMAPTAKMEGVRGSGTKSLIFLLHFLPFFFFFFYASESACLFYSSPKLPLTSLLSLSCRRLVDGWTGRWMRARRRTAAEWVNEADCSLRSRARDYRKITHSDSLLFQFRSQSLWRWTGGARRGGGEECGDSMSAHVLIEVR